MNTLALWRKACEFDGVPESSPVAVFSKKNPFALHLRSTGWYPFVHYVRPGLSSRTTLGRISLERS